MRHDLREDPGIVRGSHRGPDATVLVSHGHLKRATRRTKCDDGAQVGELRVGIRVLEIHRGHRFHEPRHDALRRLPVFIEQLLDERLGVRWNGVLIVACVGAHHVWLPCGWECWRSVVWDRTDSIRHLAGVWHEFFDDWQLRRSSPRPSGLVALFSEVRGRRQGHGGDLRTASQ